MTRDDYQELDQIQYRWQKEQQLIRRKYQIPYNMKYISPRCFNQPISMNSQTKKSLFNHQKFILSDDTLRTKSSRLNKSSRSTETNDPNIPLMYCSKCHLHLSKCSCTNGLGQWWMNCQKRSHSTDRIPIQSSIDSIRDRHVHFDSSLTDLSFTNRKSSQTTSFPQQQQYILLDWDNRQSLLHFLRTTSLYKKHLSSMTIEQLHDLIARNDHIHVFNSLIELILSINQRQSQANICQIYIDSSYYSLIQGTIPYSQSQFIADNLHLGHTLRSIQRIARLLGVKADRFIGDNEFLQEKTSIKQRKSILNQQILFITSKIPYNTFRTTSMPIQ